jgi:hypothetical protein
MRATPANNSTTMAWQYAREGDTGRMWLEGHDGRLQQAKHPRRLGRLEDACATMAGATRGGRQLRITDFSAWAMDLRTSVPECGTRRSGHGWCGATAGASGTAD